MVLAVLMVCMVFLSACASPAPKAPEAAAPSTEAPAANNTEDKIKIGLSIDAGFDARFAEVDGFYKLAKELGNVEIIEQIADNDAQKQNQQVRSLVDQGVDAICVNAIDMNTINTAIDYAASKNVIVTTFDRFLDNKNVKFGAGYDSLSDGKACGEVIKSIDDGKEHVVFELVGALNDPNGIARRDGFHSVVDSLTNLKVVQIPTDWSTEKALSGMQNALQKYPDVWAIYDASDHMDASVDTALQEKGLLKKVGEAGHVYRVSLGGGVAGYDSSIKGYIDTLMVIPMEQMGGPILESIVKLVKNETLTDTRKYVPTFALKGSDAEANKEKIWGYLFKDVTR